MARPRSLVKYVLPQQLGGTTTKAVGEEGGVTTLAVGEESAKPPPLRGEPKPCDESKTERAALLA
jgi:hypothetical protein